MTYSNTKSKTTMTIPSVNPVNQTYSYPAKFSFKNKSEIKTWSDKEKQNLFLVDSGWSSSDWKQVTPDFHLNLHEKQRTSIKAIYIIIWYYNSMFFSFS